MIIGRTTTANGEFLLLGLSRENIKRLQEGKPILIRRDSHGPGVPDGWKIAIMFGEDEKAMREELSNAGMFGPETKFHVDPRIK